MELTKLAAAAIIYKQLNKQAGFLGTLGVLGLLGGLGYGASQLFPQHAGMLKDNLWELLSTKVFGRLPRDMQRVAPPRQVATHYNTRIPFRSADATRNA